MQGFVNVREIHRDAFAPSCVFVESISTKFVPLREDKTVRCSAIVRDYSLYLYIKHKDRDLFFLFLLILFLFRKFLAKRKILEKKLYKFHFIVIKQNEESIRLKFNIIIHISNPELNFQI